MLDRFEQPVLDPNEEGLLGGWGIIQDSPADKAGLKPGTSSRITMGKKGCSVL